MRVPHARNGLNQNMAMLPLGMWLGSDCSAGQFIGNNMVSALALTLVGGRLIMMHCGRRCQLCWATSLAEASSWARGLRMRRRSPRACPICNYIARLRPRAGPGSEFYLYGFDHAISRFKKASLARVLRRKHAQLEDVTPCW